MLSDADLVLVFAERKVLEAPGWPDAVKKAYPRALVAGVSSAGEIVGTQLLVGGFTTAAAKFDHTKVRVESVDKATAGDSYAAGAEVARRLMADDLAHVFILADGTTVNGTELVRGALNELPRRVAITGGLAGDGDRFERTLVVKDDEAKPDRVVGIGLYGTKLRVGFGSMGGWDRHGGRVKITRADGNVLYEIDGRPALDVYKELLGDKASGLPATGLLFPLLVTTPDADVVRTLLAVDEKERSLTFAGDLPRDGPAFFMKANFSRLIEGARGAAVDSRVGSDEGAERLGILVSCVGRRLVLKERTAEELDAVREVLGPRTHMAGFYSYGEICPTAPTANCTLHNQTMTVTTLWET